MSTDNIVKDISILPKPFVVFWYWKWKKCNTYLIGKNHYKKCRLFIDTQKSFFSKNTHNYRSLSINISNIFYKVVSPSFICFSYLH
jgi:hypothetical protein